MPELKRQDCAVMYVRVGTHARLGDYNINQQKEACQRIAAKHGLTIVREYTDYGRAGLLRQQVGLQQVLDDLHRLRDAAYLVVYDYARLGRDMEQLAYIEEQLHACDVQIITITGVQAATRFINEHGTAEQQ
jgi:DNA invertase Pin-like site-specific DNA recombinase